MAHAVSSSPLQGGHLRIRASVRSSVSASDSAGQRQRPGARQPRGASLVRMALCPGTSNVVSRTFQLNQVSPGSVGSGSSWPGWPGPGFKSQDGLAGEWGPGQASGTAWPGPGWSPCDFPGHRAHSVSCAGPQASAMLLSPHPDPPVGIPSRPPQPTGPGVCSVPAEIMCPGQGSRRGPPPRP